MKKKCCIDDCVNAAIARSLCGKHWMRWKRWGDPNISKYPRRGLGKCPESQKRIKARYREKNREKLKASGRLYSKNNRVLANEWRRKDKVKNREAYRIKSRLWSAQRRVRTGNAKRDYNFKDVVSLHRKQKGKCVNCRVELLEYHIDHLMPLARGGLDVLSNIQLLCPPCNQKKWAKHPLDWARENGRLL